MENKKKKQADSKWSNRIIFILFGFKFRISDIALTTVLISLLIVGLISYKNKKDLLVDCSSTKCKITWIGFSSGKRVGQPECNIEYLIDNKIYKANAERPEDLDINVGECYEILYSNKDFKVFKIQFDKGSISCDDI